MNTLKKIGNYTLWVIMLTLCLPWVGMAAIGTISGGLFQAFMNGVKRGSGAVNSASIRFNTLQLQSALKRKENDKPEGTDN